MIESALNLVPGEPYSRVCIWTPLEFQPNWN